LAFFPFAAAFGENAFEQTGGGFDVRMLRSPIRRELAFDRRFQHRRPISFQLRSNPLQRRHARIESGEEFVDLLDDTASLGFRRNANPELSNLNEIDAWPVSLVQMTCKGNKIGCIEPVLQES
jgi:hypothetical protein